MIVKTWSGTLIDLRWYELDMWRRWVMGHLRSLVTADARQMRREVRARLALDAQDD
jgi:hypothetical protein